MLGHSPDLPLGSQFSPDPDSGDASQFEQGRRDHPDVGLRGVYRGARSCERQGVRRPHSEGAADSFACVRLVSARPSLDSSVTRR
jgi:hypothetical protein